MIPNFKSLFVKTGPERPATETSKPGGYVFPAPYAPAPPTAATPDDTLTEVLKAYENGLETPGRPGYDFYAFYQAITAAGSATGPAYQMAYHMARALDKTVTPGKLIDDAAFYLGKVGDMHRQYVTQGQQKLQALREKKHSEQAQLNARIAQATERMTQLRAELIQLQADIDNDRNALEELDKGEDPQERSVQEKLSANEQAHRISIDRLTGVREGIRQYLGDSSANA